MRTEPLGDVPQIKQIKNKFPRSPDDAAGEDKGTFDTDIAAVSDCVERAVVSSIPASREELDDTSSDRALLSAASARPKPSHELLRELEALFTVDMVHHTMDESMLKWFVRIVG